VQTDRIIKVLRPSQQKIGHFGDVPRSQSLGFSTDELKQTQ